MLVVGAGLTLGPDFFFFTQDFSLQFGGRVFVLLPPFPVLF